MAGEATAPLVMPRSAAVETPAAAPQEAEAAPAAGDLHRRRVRKRRSSGSGDGEGPSWEHGTRGAYRSGRSERRRMAWMLAGGVGLFLVIVGGIVFALRNGGGDETVSSGGPLPAPPVVDAGPAKTDKPEVPKLMNRPEAVLLAEAETLARKFLTAKEPADLLRVVRDPATAEARLRREYPTGRIDPPGMAEFNSGRSVNYGDHSMAVDVRTADFSLRQMDFVETSAGLRVDWESWVGWCDLPWSEFLQQRPVAPTVFRVLLRKVDYYNFGFTDDVKWRSYRLESQDGEAVVYAYVERGGVLDQRIQLDPDAKLTRLTLKLRFPEGAPAQSNQVLIDDLVTEGWVEPNRAQP